MEDVVGPLGRERSALGVLFALLGGTGAGRGGGW